MPVRTFASSLSCSIVTGAPSSAPIEESQKRENAELRRVNEILKAASAFFAAELCATRRRSDRVEVGDLRRRAVAAV
jgi:hypothetical protein